MSGTLYLIPTPLGEDDLREVLPPDVIARACALTHFVVEAPKTARAHLKRFGTTHELRSLWLQELNEHTRANELPALLEPLLAGHDVGLMSEAGCPGVADPGAQLVRLAHQNGVRVAPLVGPSSILLALMASGANGQKFRFNGYLPSGELERVQAIRNLEASSAREGQAELFIETPYRNDALFAALLANCKPGCWITVACQLTQGDEFTLSLPVSQWRKHPAPELHKKPTMFVLQSS